MLERKPNLFVVGAMKAGTTSLHASLSRSAEVFCPAHKELNHFCTDLYRHRQFHRTSTVHKFHGHQWVGDADRYEDFFRSAPPTSRYLLDASTTYLYSTEAAGNIRAYSPSARIVVLLRDPVVRAWSEYLMNRFIGIEKDGFVTAIREEERMLKSAEFDLFRRYIYAGRYGGQIARYIECFGREAVFVDVIDRPGERFEDVLRRLQDFLELKSPLTPVHENAAEQPTLPRLNALLYDTGLKALTSRLIPQALKKPIKSVFYRKVAGDHFDPAFRALLLPIFAADVTQTESLTGLDLGHWNRTVCDEPQDMTTLRDS